MISEQGFYALCNRRRLQDGHTGWVGFNLACPMCGHVEVIYAGNYTVSKVTCSKCNLTVTYEFHKSPEPPAKGNDGPYFVWVE